MTGTSHLIGLLLGTEEDWPTAFEEILRRLGPVTGPDGARHARSLRHLDDVVLDWVAGPGFDGLLVRTVRSQYPAHEHDQFIAHFRGLLGLWVSDENARLRTG
jgi:hypothetical protein